MLNNFKFIDLSHDLHETIPVWPNAKRFEREMPIDYGQAGYRVEKYTLAAGTGTHMDAPSHFVKGGRTISDFNLAELIVPACVLDISKQAAANPDYIIKAEDLMAWEKQRCHMININ